MTVVDEETEAPRGTMWVRSWRLPGGRGYGASIQMGPVTFGLTPDRALAYAAELVRRSIEAEHDAAVIRLLTQPGRANMPVEQAAMFVSADLRQDRAVDHEATAPLAFEAGINPQLVPFVKVMHEGKQIAQQTPKEARHHAMSVLDVIAAADLDSALERALMGLLGLDRAQASAVINGLGSYWPDEEPEPAGARGA
jgi:hypothetical protein